MWRLMQKMMKSVDDKIYSYDMKVVTKEWSMAEKISTPVMGIEPGPPG